MANLEAFIFRLSKLPRLNKSGRSVLDLDFPMVLRAYLKTRLFVLRVRRFYSSSVCRFSCPLLSSRTDYVSVRKILNRLIFSKRCSQCQPYNDAAFECSVGVHLDRDVRPCCPRCFTLITALFGADRRAYDVVTHV